MAPRTHVHREGGPACDLPTKKACEDRKAEWDAMQQVILAYNIVMRGDTKPYRKDKTAFAQLVKYIAGEQDEMMNDEGNPSRAPWVMRLRAAIARVIAGDLPVYTLYRPQSGQE